MILTHKYMTALMVMAVSLAMSLLSAQSIGAPRVYEAGASNNGSSNQAVGELFYQLQIMQEEMSVLRGTVEELQNEIARLKSERLKDYKGLDKRIRELSTGTNPAGSSVQSNTVSSQVANTGGMTGTAAVNTSVITPESAAATGSNSKASVTPPVVKIDEKTQYRTAYGLVRAKKFKEAKSALQEYLKDYPSGRYTPNGMYWLAELHLVDKEYSQAITLFSGIATQYKSHRKTPDARFKLAKIHHNQGEKDKAKQILTSIVAEYSPEKVSAAKLASNFLKKHYPQ